MHYEIFDSTGNLVESFPDEDSARRTLDLIVDAEPDAAEDIALFVSDDNGVPVRGPVFAHTISSTR
ncbi:MAG TPA: hypothetical protein VGI24_00860 [Solirubrobacteraceae bacterium]|jgi:hypothetical protein